jgi:4-hydroxy-2-oxoheptanedioate aldolase
MRRDVGTLRDAGSPAYVAALDEVVVGVMIEKREAFEALVDLLAVPGIDMVQFGPADFAMSIGRTGEQGHPDVVAAERRVIEAALARGLHPRAEIREPAQAGRYWEMGVRDFCIGWDVSILHDFWRQSGQALGALFAGAEPPAGEAGPAGNYR